MFLPYGRGWGGVWCDLPEQLAGEVEYLPGHPVAGGKNFERGIRLAEIGEQLIPAPCGPRSGALRDVAEHAHRTSRCPAANRPAGHRREVLRFVDDAVCQARRPLDQIRD